MRAASQVVAGYDERVSLYRAEIAAVERPSMLRRLLRATRHVAELPCGTGHFLAEYAAAGAEVTLIDANHGMVAAALERAAEVGLPPARVHGSVCYAQRIDGLSGVDLLVLPNAALNQLACQTPLAELFGALRCALRPGAVLLAQALCAHADGVVDVAGCYDARRPDGEWIADRVMCATPPVTRHRRQRHVGGLVLVDFDYNGSSPHSASVELRLVTPRQLADALRTAGFTLNRFRAGRQGLSDLVATVEGGPR